MWFHMETLMYATEPKQGSEVEEIHFQNPQQRFRAVTMQSSCLISSSPFLGQIHFRPRLFPSLLPSRCLSSDSCSCSRILCSSDGGKKKGRGSRGGGGGEGVKVKVKEKENIWSIENDLAEKASNTGENKVEKGRTRRRGRPVGSVGKRRRNSSKVLVSGAMLNEIDTVLQTQEPVIKPVWNTFASSTCGIWRGVGAAFSPLTAEMEPIGIGKKNENLYDCYTVSCIQNSHYTGNHLSRIHQKTNWVSFNPFGEIQQNSLGGEKSRKHVHMGGALPLYESFDFESSEILKEELLSMEPGFVFFEDGSHSRGPIEIPVGDYDDSKYFLSPTFQFEQCLVKGSHRRLRILHTIEFSEGGSNIQIIRVAVYEEEWVRPSNLEDDGSDSMFALKPFSQRKRIQLPELTGYWKVFETNATPIFTEDETGDEGGLPYVYLCTETLKKRSLPENQKNFGEEEFLDTQDATVLWLPGGVTAYVDVNNDGILCIGVGWYSEEGINLVMERDYGMDGKLKEVRWKSELKRR